METGTIVATMPPDVPSPTGGYVIPGRANQGLVLGDTVGRTPGAYGFVVSCDMQGYVRSDATVISGRLVLVRNKGTSLHPLSSRWTYPGGSGPAALQLDMARKFGDSPFLEAGDYTADPDLYGFADQYSLTAKTLTFPLNANSVALLTTIGDNQFRVTMLPSQFSNFNGAFRQPYGSEYLSFFGSTARIGNRPYLTLMVSMALSPPLRPPPSPTPPSSPPGVILSNNIAAQVIEYTCEGGPDGVFEGISKGNEINTPATTTIGTIGAKFVKGMYLAAKSDSGSPEPGRNGLRIGDGFHDYILASFVSCNTDAIPAGARVTEAVLTLRTSRVYGGNPFLQGGCCGGATIQVDMSPAFNGNPLLEIGDFSALPRVANAATVIGTIPPAPTSLRFQLKPSVATRLENNKEVQFRLIARTQDGMYYTNHNDRPESLDFFGGLAARPALRPSLTVTYTFDSMVTGAEYDDYGNDTMFDIDNPYAELFASEDASPFDSPGYVSPETLAAASSFSAAGTPSSGIDASGNSDSNSDSDSDTTASTSGGTMTSSSSRSSSTDNSQVALRYGAAGAGGGFVACGILIGTMYLLVNRKRTSAPQATARLWHTAHGGSSTTPASTLDYDVSTPEAERQRLQPGSGTAGSAAVKKQGRASLPQAQLTSSGRKLVLDGGVMVPGEGGEQSTVNPLVSGGSGAAATVKANRLEV